MRNISRAEFLNTATFALVGLGLYGCGQSAGDAAPTTDAASEEAEAAETEDAPEADPGIWVISKMHRVVTVDGEEEENSVTEYELDEQGNLVGVPALVDGGTITLGAETEFDENGWRTSQVSISPDPSGDESVEPTRTTTEYQNEYDDEGRLVSTSWEEAHMGGTQTATTSYTYNDDGNISLIEHTDYFGKTTTHVNGDGLYTEYSNEPSPESQADAAVITFEYEWDDAGHLTGCTASYDSGYKILNTYVCDDNGNVVSRESRSVKADGEESPVVTTFEYEYEHIENPSMGARILNHVFERVWGMF